MLNPELREKLKHISDELGIIAGKHERAEDLLTDRDKDILSDYFRILENSASSLLRMVELTDQALTYVLNRQK